MTIITRNVLWFALGFVGWVSLAYGYLHDSDIWIGFAVVPFLIWVGDVVRHVVRDNEDER